MNQDQGMSLPPAQNLGSSAPHRQSTSQHRTQGVGLNGGTTLSQVATTIYGPAQPMVPLHARGQSVYIPGTQNGPAASAYVSPPHTGTVPTPSDTGRPPAVVRTLSQPPVEAGVYMQPTQPTQSLVQTTATVTRESVPSDGSPGSQPMASPDPNAGPPAQSMVPAYVHGQPVYTSGVQSGPATSAFTQASQNGVARTASDAGRPLMALRATSQLPGEGNEGIQQLVAVASTLLSMAGVSPAGLQDHRGAPVYAHVSTAGSSAYSLPYRASTQPPRAPVTTALAPPPTVPVHVASPTSGHTTVQEVIMQPSRGTMALQQPKYTPANEVVIDYARPVNVQSPLANQHSLGNQQSLAGASQQSGPPNQQSLPTNQQYVHRPKRQSFSGPSQQSVPPNPQYMPSEQRNVQASGPQYARTPRPQYAQTPEQQSAQTPGPQYAQAPGQHYAQGPGGQYVQATGGQYVQAPERQSIRAPVQQFVQSPEQQYVQAPEQQYVQAPEQQYVQAPEQQYVQAPEQQYVQAPKQQYVLLLRSNSTRRLRSNSPFLRRFNNPFLRVSSTCRLQDINTCLQSSSLLPRVSNPLLRPSNLSLRTNSQFLRVNSRFLRTNIHPLLISNRPRATTPPRSSKTSCMRLHHSNQRHHMCRRLSSRIRFILVPRQMRRRRKRRNEPTSDCRYSV